MAVHVVNRLVDTGVKAFTYWEGYIENGALTVCVRCRHRMLHIVIDHVEVDLPVFLLRISDLRMADPDGHKLTLEELKTYTQGLITWPETLTPGNDLISG